MEEKNIKKISFLDNLSNLERFILNYEPKSLESIKGHEQLKIAKELKEKVDKAFRIAHSEFMKLASSTEEKN